MWNISRRFPWFTDVLNLPCGLLLALCGLLGFLLGFLLGCGLACLLLLLGLLWCLASCGCGRLLFVVALSHLHGKGQSDEKELAADQTNQREARVKRRVSNQSGSSSGRGRNDSTRTLPLRSSYTSDESQRNNYKLVVG